MKTDNELIAEFMGGKWETVWCGGIETKAFNFPKWHITDWPHQIHEDTFQYKTSWDWLMPVVEKIDELYKKAFPPGEVFIRRVLEKEELFDGPYMDVVAIPMGTPINEVYEAVVKFIKWYNSNKS